MDTPHHPVATAATAGAAGRGCAEPFCAAPSAEDPHQAARTTTITTEDPEDLLDTEVHNQQFKKIRINKNLNLVYATLC